MADLEWAGRPERPSLRRAIRHEMRRVDPTIRVVAENFLAESSPIDLLAVGAEGEMISLRISSNEDEMALLTRALADLTWLRPRLADFLKLAPGLGIEPSAEPRAILFATNFNAEIHSAVKNFPARSIELLTYHCFRQQGQLSVLFENAMAAGNRRSQDAGRETPRSTVIGPDRREPLAGSPSPSSFRTGLTEADLRDDADDRDDVDDEKVLGWPPA